MDRGTALLQGLRKQLEGWRDRIKRATGASLVELVPGEKGEFTAHVEWTTRRGEKKSLDRPFTRLEVFGSSYTQGMMHWQVQKRVCFYARAVIGDVLAARGI